MDVIQRLSQPKGLHFGISRPPTVSESIRKTVRPEVIQRLSEPKRPSAGSPRPSNPARPVQQTVPLDLIQRLSQPRKTPSRVEEPGKSLRPDQQLSPSRFAARPKTPRKELECVVCMNLVDKRRVVSLPCQHTFCRACLMAGFKSALSSRKLFKCCGTRVSTTYDVDNLPIGLIASYKTLVMELTTRNPIYCSKISCGAFIPPTNIRGPVAICTKYLGASSKKCGSKTCVMCKKPVHKGICKEDKDGMLVKALAKEMNVSTQFL